MTSSSPYCPKCGGKNEPGAVTCFACGESLLAAAPLAYSASAGMAPRVTLGLPVPHLLIRQRYHIVKRIGEGGFGAVYQAEDLELGKRLVAVKEMSHSGLASQELQEATEAFHHEAMLLAGLSHPSLPRIYDHFSEGGHWYLVMEFIEGETLEKRLERSSHKHLSVQEALQFGLKLCDVLEYLHTRQPPIIFRDLKPSNVMLTPDGAAYLIDFGIARLFKPGQQKDTMAFGSPGYAAPEQYGKAQTTPRSDVFSLGALLHQMLTGNDPSDTPFRFAPLTMPRPTGLGTFIGQMVSLDEYRRPPSIGIVRRELERLAAAWAERQRGQTSTMAFPPYQTATGFFPAVRPPYQTGAAPTSGGPHWLPPSQHTMPPTQATGAWRAVGPPQPYPWPARAPVAPPAWPRKRRRWWLLFLAILSVGLPLALTLGVGAFLLGHRFVQPGSGGHVYTVAWSPDGTKIASAGADDIVHVWDAVTGASIATYQGHTDVVDYLAWSPDGQYLASASDDTLVRVWEVASGSAVYTYVSHSARVSELAWSPDSQRIASASDDGTVQVWDATTGKNKYTYAGHSDAVYAVAWSPDGKYLASGGADGTVRVWDAKKGATRTTYSDSNTAGVKSISWSPDSALIASTGDDGTVQVWKTATGNQVLTYGGDIDKVETVAWSPNGQYIASGGDDKVVQVWDAKTGTSTYEYTGHSGTVWEVAWSSDSNRIASASDDGTVQVWDALTGNHVLTFPSQS